MPDISITAYTRSTDSRKRLRVKVYDDGHPTLPKQMEVRSGDVCFYLDVNDARTLAETMLAELKTTALA